MGTTSFRTADFNQKIERQLTLLSKFWEVHTDVVWSGNDEIQSLYYDFMKDNDFLTGDAPNKPKDAREKTSGLIDLGLIDNERRPTAAGESLRQITSNGDFRPNNLLQIPADSYIYFKQMLKTSNDVDGEIVRPFVVLVLALKQLEYLTQEEFTYLLPLITTSRKFRTIVDCIKRLRKGDITIDEIIVDTLLTMENYREARLYLLERPVSEHVICQAGINRKSRQYDSTYYPLYRTIESLDRNNAQSILDLLQACRSSSPGGVDFSFSVLLIFVLYLLLMVFLQIRRSCYFLARVQIDDPASPFHGLSDCIVSAALTDIVPIRHHDGGPADHVFVPAQVASPVILFREHDHPVRFSEQFTVKQLVLRVKPCGLAPERNCRHQCHVFMVFPQLQNRFRRYHVEPLGHA